LHCYWKLNELVPTNEIEEMNRLLEVTLGGDPVGQPNRLLRIPGTVNEKPGGGNVELLALESRTVEASALRDLQPPMPQPMPARVPTRSKTPDADPEFQELLNQRNWGEIELRFDTLSDVHGHYLAIQPARGWHRGGYPSRSECEAAIVTRLIWRGASDRQIEELADEHFAKHREELARGKGYYYLQRTISSARLRAYEGGWLTSPHGGWPKPVGFKKRQLTAHDAETIYGLVHGQSRAALVREIQSVTHRSRSAAYSDVAAMLDLELVVLRDGGVHQVAGPIPAGDES
jgi:hypothetical protein